VTDRSPSFPVLIDRRAIRVRIEALGREIARAHPAFGELCVVSVIEGARTFCRALLPLLPGPPRVHEIRASSYGTGTVSAGVVQVSGGERIDCAGRTVLLVEDIVDTGRTVARLGEHFLAQGAVGVEVATLLTKPSRREVEVELAHVGFEIDDHFVIGFGMDVDGRYRELPDIVVYEAK
jgi:hypoxanthine phosphoribosyltransferase